MSKSISGDSAGRELKSNNSPRSPLFSNITNLDNSINSHSEPFYLNSPEYTNSRLIGIIDKTSRSDEYYKFNNQYGIQADLKNESYNLSKRNLQLYESGNIFNSRRVEIPPQLFNPYELDDLRNKKKYLH